MESNKRKKPSSTPVVKEIKRRTQRVFSVKAKIMKKSLHIFLILSVIFLITGTFLKLNRLPFSDLIMLGALMITIPVASILYCVDLYKRHRNIYLLFAFIPVILLCVGMDILLNHYPYGMQLFYIGLGVCGVYLLILLFSKLINAGTFSSMNLAEILVLILIPGLILAGYVTGNRWKWSQQMNDEVRFISLQKKSRDMKFVNRSLYITYPSIFKHTRIQLGTEKVIYTLDTLQQKFIDQFFGENDTAQLFVKSQTAAINRYFISGGDSSRKELLQQSLKKYLDFIKERHYFIYLNSSESTYLKDLLDYNNLRSFTWGRISWGDEFYKTPATILVFLEQVKLNVLLCENIIINNILREKPAQVTIAGIPGGQISKKELFQAKRIESTDSNLHIISYVLVYITKIGGFVCELPYISNNLPDNWNEIQQTWTGKGIWIEDVRAINLVGDTVHLEGARLKIK